ncbi:MAG TPA: hypothetical protein VHM21_07060 [Sphingomicrobium sp.]|jgi:hypothetical protein|nr:hypothetical protein [Sphingomicrobium sp.]
MHTTRPLNGPDQRLGDRRLILIDVAPRQQGIAAALRRAFERVEPADDDDFSELLKRI